MPGFDNSAMDGFAVRAADTAAAQHRFGCDWSASRARAGRPECELGPGEAMRISTGAMVPAGADAVVRVEDTSEHPEPDSAARTRARSWRCWLPSPPARDIRRAGEDIRAGERVLDPGGVSVRQSSEWLPRWAPPSSRARGAPSMSIVSTGDELTPPGAAAAPGAIRNTNAYALPAQATLAGARTIGAETVGDDHQATVEALRRALEADVAVMTGGVSVGPHDHVKPALAELGVEEVFWGVALRPGKPTWFGTCRATTEAPARVRPARATRCRRWSRSTCSCARRSSRWPGASPGDRRATAVMDEDYASSPAGRTWCAAGWRRGADGWHVRPTKAQGSHVLTSMLDAEALAYWTSTAGTCGRRAGRDRDPVTVLRLETWDLDRDLGGAYPYRSPVSARSFTRLCVACTLRTVPDRERITSESVVASAPSR